MSHDTGGGGGLDWKMWVIIILLVVVAGMLGYYGSQGSRGSGGNPGQNFSRGGNPCAGICTRGRDEGRSISVQGGVCHC
jgi:hypothetical protein